MVFKRGVALLVLAAAAAVASTEASAPITVHSSLKHPAVKDVKEQNGKLILTLHEDTKVQKKTVAKKHETKKQEVKKLAPKKPFVVKVAPKKDQHKKHPEAKKHQDKKHQDKKHHDAKKHKEVKKANHKQVSEEKKGHEVIRKYAHGEVRIAAKNQPAQKKQEKKPVVKKEAPKKHLTKEEVAETIEETDVDLQAGESVSLEFGNHTIELELLTNGSLILTADDETYVLPAGDVDLDFDGDVDGADVDEDSSSSADSDADVGSAADEVEAAAGDVTKEESVAEKFTELATKLTGNGKYFSKDAAPIVFAGGVIGALAAIVGIAAIAIGRARDNSAAADPQSVLAEATEDVDADVEAAASTEESSEDAAADDSQSLDSSDSDSDAEEEQEEGKFTNEVASV